ncbi:MAG TPA: NADH:flavin oxidoreductase [Kofleriaceae bacterium]
MLHESLTLRSGLVIPNRVALAAMTNGQSHADGSLGDDELHWLERRAIGGFGLVCTCAAYVAKDGKAWDGELGIDREDDLPGLTRLATAIKRHGSTAIVQLFHGGVRATQRLSGEQVWSASEFHEDGADFEMPRAATDADIERTIEAFAAAADRCKRAGFDGVELHGAHGYLITQFVSHVTNTRTDRWGGDVAGRARFAREVLRAVRARVGARFTVGIRLSLEHGGSARGLDLDESLQLAAWLCEDGADFIHASLWRAESNTRKRPDEHPIPLVRAAVPKDVAVIVAGNIWTYADAALARERGADMVALARAAIINPDWPKLVKPGWEPHRPPLTRAEYGELAVSPAFAVYLKHFKGLVAD